MASLEVTEKAEEEEAYQSLIADPAVGRPRPRTRPGVLGHHIEQPGRKARHVVFYKYDPTTDYVTVLRVLHDSMDFGRHLP